MKNRVLALLLCSAIVGSGMTLFSEEPRTKKGKSDDSWKQELARAGMDLGSDLIKTGSEIGKAFALAEAQRRAREGAPTTGAVTAEDIAKISDKLVAIQELLSKLVTPALVSLDNKIDLVRKEIGQVDDKIDSVKLVRIASGPQKKALATSTTPRALTTGSKIEEID